MNYTIVYKTYKNDLEWLKYSILSVDKFLTDNYDILIYYHDECEKDINDILSDLKLKTKYRLIPVSYDINGYLKQMVIKCMCFKDIESDLIMIMDSDVIFNDYFSYKDIISDGKINWYFLERNTENYNQDQWLVWEKSVLGMTGEKMSKFYMYNGFPFLFKRKT
jgi:hypothetical protein